MKLIRLFFFLLLINFNLLAQNNLQKIPSIEIKSLEGATINFTSIQNQDIASVVCFTAISCKNCTKELEAISEVYDDWSDEFDFEVIIISVDDARSSSKVAPYIRAKDWPFHVYLDTNGELKRALNINNIPHTLLLNAHNEIVWQKAGYIDGDEDFLYEEILKYL